MSADLGGVSISKEEPTVSEEEVVTEDSTVEE